MLALIAWKRPRLHWVRWLLLVAMLGLALLQVRHQAMLAIVAAMILPQGFARANRRAASIRPSTAGYRARRRRCSSSSCARSCRCMPPENEANPWKLIASVPPELRSQPVLNGYSMGGPLILSGIRPYVDGRGDMYGDELVVGFSRIAHGDAASFDEAVQRWNIRWAMLPKGQQADRRARPQPGWRQIHRDKVGVIYVPSKSAPVFEVAVELLAAVRGDRQALPAVPVDLSSVLLATFR